MNEEYIKFFGSIQIIRNVKKYPFVQSMNDDEKKELTQTVMSTIQDGGYKCRLLERGIILSNIEYFNILYGLSPKDDFSVLHVTGGKSLESDIFIIMCSDDHLKYRVCLSRTQHFEDIYPQVAKVVQLVGETLPYQADLRYGYLSPKLTQAGLGLTLSYMMHGPGLKIVADDKFISDMKERGYRLDRMVVRNKDHKERELNFIRIVSDRQYGVSEDDLVRDFSSGIDTFISMENRELIKYYNKNKDRFDDKILRSFGILKYSKSIAFDEAVNMLDDVLIGLRVMLLEYATAKIPKATVCDLLLQIFDGVIAAQPYGKCDDIAERRSEIIKSYLRKIKEA